MKLYHSTLEQNAERINREGIRLNSRKAERSDKAYTDLFNWVFNQKSGLYLPETIAQKKIDRNTAIFLSAHPGEFRKSENLTAYAEHQGLIDVVYEVDIGDENLPVFDADDFSAWAGQFKEFLLGVNLLESYFSQAQNEQQARNAFHALMRYLISGDTSEIQKIYPDANLQHFENLREQALEHTLSGVRNYASGALNLKDFSEQFSYLEENGKIIWVENNEHPRIISSLEILCNHDIPPEKIKRM